MSSISTFYQSVHPLQRLFYKTFPRFKNRLVLTSEFWSIAILLKSTQKYSVQNVPKLNWGLRSCVRLTALWRQETYIPQISSVNKWREDRMSKNIWFWRIKISRSLKELLSNYIWIADKIFKQQFEAFEVFWKIFWLKFCKNNQMDEPKAI